MCNFVFVSKLYSNGLLYLELSKEVSYEVYCKLPPQPLCILISGPLSNTLRSYIDAERFHQPICC
jgi:hypothetical protein